MIKLFCGPESAEKNGLILKMISESCARAIDASKDKDTTSRNALSEIETRRVCLIVPEQQAVIWETRLAKSVPPESALVLDVVSFTRLANLVKRRFGGLSFNSAGRADRVLLMWKAIASVAPLLRVFGNEKNSARTVKIMQEALDELRRGGVGAEDAARLSDIFSSEEATASLSDRLHDISLVMAEYENSFGESFDDPGAEPEHLLDTLRRRDFFSGYDVYVDSFYSLTAVEEKIVREIIRQSDNFTMTFTCPAGGEIPPHLGVAYRFFLSVKEFAARCEDVEINEITSDASTPSAYLRDHLWDFSAEPMRGEKDFVSFVRCADRYDEAQAALCRVRELVGGGADYSDIAIIARDASTRTGILDAAFADANIPLSVSVRFSLSDSPAVRFVQAALCAVKSSFAREDVCALLHSSLTPLSADERAAFERYTEIWNISGKRAYEKDGGWTMNPDGFSASFTPRASRELELANSAREKICDMLLPLSEAFKNEACVSDVLTELWRMLVGAGAYERLRENCARLAENGYRDAAAFGYQSWLKLTEAFEAAERILGDIAVDISTFADLFSLTIGAEDVGTIPAGINEVLFGAADRIRTENISHVILLGAVDGEFPGVPSESALFTEVDRIRLEGEGVVLSDNERDRTEKELFWFWRCASLPSKTLCVMIPESSGVRKTEASTGAQRIAGLFPDAPEIYFDPDSPAAALWDEKDSASFILSCRNEKIRSAILAASPEAGLSLTAARGDTDWSRICAEEAESIFGDRIKLTQSRFETYRKCAFSYYGRYILDLDEREEKHLSPVDVGNFIHAVLERYFTETDVSALPLSEDENLRLIRRLVSEYTDGIFGTAVTPRIRYLLDRLEKSLLLFTGMLGEEFAQSDFRPFALEQKIGMGDGTPPALSIPMGDGSSVELRGIIDRLDVMRRDGKAYIRVVDYKTGAKKLSDRDMELGLNMQLFMYLFSVWKCPPCEFRTRLLGNAEEIVPAAALYFSARPGEALSPDDPRERALEVAASSVVRSGRFLADEAVLRAQDAQLEGKYIPVKQNKNGEFSSNVTDLRGFEELLRALCERISSAAEEMQSGKADALPLFYDGGVPCRYCKLRMLCRNTDGRCKYR